MIATDQTHVPTGQFREASAEALPHADQAFDLVFMGLLLHQTDEPLQALREARRVVYKRVAIDDWRYEVDAFRPLACTWLVNDPSSLSG